jgi:hypothetical protein
VAEAIVERTAARALLDRLAAVTPGRDGDGDLRDRSWQRRMFADREEHLLEGVARRLRRASKGDAFEVFNAAQPHLLALARAHVHRLMLEAFAGRRPGLRGRRRRPGGRGAARRGLRPLRARDDRGTSGPGTWSTAA